MRMHNPPHPGEIIKSLCLEPLAITVIEAAKAMARGAVAQAIARYEIGGVTRCRTGKQPIRWASERPKS